MFYTKLDEKSLQQIVQVYDIAPIVNWKLLEGGAENTNHVLETTAEKYVLTICERKTFEETTILVNLLKHLEQHQFKTTKVVPNKAGKAIHFFNKKPVILKEYIEGQIVENYSPTLLQEVGKVMGYLHLIPPTDELPNAYSCGKETFPTLTKSVIDHPFVDWLRDMNDYILATINSSFPKALIHGDVFFSNVIIDAENKPIIFDFEEACHYYRMFDIGMTIVGLCQAQRVVDFTKVEHLISGYEAIIVLEKEEKAALKFFICYAATTMTFWRFRQFNILAPTPSRKDTYLELKKIADAMRE